MPALEARRKSSAAAGFPPADEPEDAPEADAAAAPAARLEGGDSLTGVVLVDQTSLGRTPRSNPAVYVGAFDEIRDFFAASEPARKKGLTAGSFSFNSNRGRCEKCGGLGFEKVEMQFLSDVFIPCPACDGRRYQASILELKVRPPGSGGARGLSIGDVLELTIEEAGEFLGRFPDSAPARRAQARLRLLLEVGLGYLKLGQPINTLSGGESQRLKLVRHLAEAEAARGGESPSERSCQLFVFDEPTTGLHFEDVRVLLQVFQRLVDAGHSLLVIEHSLDVIKCADWVIDLGPGAGDEGGRIVVEGTPEAVAACAASHTGQALAGVLTLPKRGSGRRERKGDLLAARSE